jgi:hypothetical protein
MKTLFLLLVAVAAGWAPALADPVTYDINFSTTSGSPAPGSGSFTYDPSVGFSDFIVDWDGITFNLTNAANAPTQSKSEQGHCSGSVSTPATGFSIISQELTGCAGLSTYEWIAGTVADKGAPGLVDDSFIFGDLNGVVTGSTGINSGFQGVAIFDHLDGVSLGTSGSLATGEWTVTPASVTTSPVPEPITLPSILFGTLVLGWLWRYRKPHRTIEIN